MTTELFSIEELLMVLDSSVSDDNKIALLKFTTNPISTNQKSLSTSVKLHILRNNLDPNDLRLLRKDYHKLDSEIQEFVLEKTIANIAALIENPVDISNALIDAVFVSNRLTDAIKLSLIVKLMPTLSRDECRRKFGLMNRDDFASIFESRKKPKFDVSQENLEVLKAMKTRGWIYEYYKEENSNCYRIRRTKPQQKLDVELL